MRADVSRRRCQFGAPDREGRPDRRTVVVSVRSGRAVVIKMRLRGDRLRQVTRILARAVRRRGGVVGRAHRHVRTVRVRRQSTIGAAVVTFELRRGVETK